MFGCKNGLGRSGLLRPGMWGQRLWQQSGTTTDATSDWCMSRGWAWRRGKLMVVIRE